MGKGGSVPVKENTAMAEGALGIPALWRGLMASRPASWYGASAITELTLGHVPASADASSAAVVIAAP
jgi:hypothetical protein